LENIVAGLKSILCLFDGDDRQLPALDLALGLSVRHGAFVHVLHVTEPIDPYLELNPSQEASLIHTFSQVSDDIGRIVRARSERFGKRLWHGGLNSQEFYEAGVGFETVTGFSEKIIPRVARTNDLIICSKPPSKKTTTPDAFMSVLARSGRPVLLAPIELGSGSPGELFSADVAVAWDRSVQATRSIHNLLPCLQPSCQLHLISVAEHGKKIDVRDDPAVIYWLKRHNFIPTVHHFEQGDRGVGEILLSKAHEIGASVLAAGAYGQNAIVEKLIGGTTIDLYRHSALPLFLTH
jgi:nucleotide-binding universal stress UspA family protein